MIPSVLFQKNTRLLLFHAVSVSAAPLWSHTTTTITTSFLTNPKRRRSILSAPQQRESSSVPCSQRKLFSSSNKDNTSSKNHELSNSTDDRTSEKNDADSQIKSSTTSSSSSSSTKGSTTTTAPRSSFSRRFRQGVGGLFSAAGFLSSSVKSVIRNPQRVYHQQLKQPLEAFRDFLKTSGIDTELDQALFRSPGLSFALLARVHAQLYFTNETPNNHGPKQHNNNHESPLHHHQQKEEEDDLPALFWIRAKRYMRYATAVYGPSMIRAASVDAGGVRWRDLAQTVGQATLPAISKHIGVPVDDLVWVDVDVDYEHPHHQAHSGNDNGETKMDPKPHCLRHLVAIDHVHREVVLAIRGTFSLQEIVVDIAGSFTRDGFCGGEAHEGMATMAERLWQVAGRKIVDTLSEHPDYELVVTGHSLGAGTATLLTILLKQQQQQQQQQLQQKFSFGTAHNTANNNNNKGNLPPLLSPSTSLCCFAFASPPVFTPLPVVPEATKVITHFIHETDCVPFLSVDSVRQLLAQLRAIQSVSATLSWSQRLAIVSGSQPPPDEMIDAVRTIPSSVLLPKKGAPRLQVPASQTVWLLQDMSNSNGNDHVVRYKRRIERHPSFPTIRVHPNMFLDHFPARYEYALEHLQEEATIGSSTMSKK